MKISHRQALPLQGLCRTPQKHRKCGVRHKNTVREEIYTLLTLFHSDRSMIPHMRRISLIILVLASCHVYAGVDVTFPPTERPKDTAKLRLFESAITDDSPEPKRIDGLVVYFSGAHYYGGEAKKAEDFDKLKEAMTLREIVSLLGPGSQNKFEGVGFITWRCEDGRVLQVWPTSQIDEKANYHISLRGENQRHDDVRQLAKALIERLEIAKQNVAVALAEDTHQAKAGEVKTYEVGQTFQKVDPLPRIDFTISKIEGDSVHCAYFYQALPEGLLRYSETGTLILHNREQGVAPQSATRSESDSEGDEKPQPESELRPR